MNDNSLLGKSYDGTTNNPNHTSSNLIMQVPPMASDSVFSSRGSIEKAYKVYNSSRGGGKNSNSRNISAADYSGL